MSSIENKIKYQEILELWSSFDVGSYWHPSWVTPSGEGLGLGGMLPTRSKVQHLLGAFNPLGPSDWGKLIAP